MPRPQQQPEEVVVDLDIPKAFVDIFKPSRYKVYHGGRGSSKSWSIARAIIIKAISAKESILCTREYQKSIKNSAKKLLENQIELMGLSEYFRITRDEIVCTTTGTTIIFLGLWHNPQTIKSLEGITIVWVEEANAVSQESLDYLIPTIREEDSEIWFTFNRRDETDPVDKMFLSKSAKRTNVIIVQVNYDENPFFTKVLRDEMEYDKKHDTNRYQHIWLGKPRKQLASLVFKKWRQSGNIEPDENEVLYYGADWGFSVDPSVLLRCWANHDKRELYVDYEAYGVGVEIDKLPDMFDKVPGAKKWKITGDSARPETISYLKKRGFKIKSAKKGKGSVEDGIEFLKSYTIVVHERCKHLIDELGLYCYKMNKLTGEILPLLEDKNNHCIDALRYALEQLVFRKININVG